MRDLMHKTDVSLFIDLIAHESIGHIGNNLWPDGYWQQAFPYSIWEFYSHLKQVLDERHKNS